MTEKQSGIRLSLFPMEMKLQIQPGAANKISPAGRKFPYSEFQVCMNATGSVSILKGVGMFPRKVTRGVMLPGRRGNCITACRSRFFTWKNRKLPDQYSPDVLESMPDGTVFPFAKQKFHAINKTYRFYIFNQRGE